MKDIYKLPSRYTIHCTIGKGSIGKVLKAYDSLSKRLIAIKVIYNAVKLSEISLKREFNILSKLQHSNLIKVFDFGFSISKTPYFTMEFVEGQDLRIFLQNHNNIAFLPKIIRQALSALKYLHKNGVIHGDIKPENIMIIMNESGEIITKLLDFGLTTRIRRKKKIISGTPRFLAPEVLASNSYSPASDLYALGASIIECITQKKFPIATNISETFHRNTYHSINKHLSIGEIPNPLSTASYLLNLVSASFDERLLSAEDAFQTYISLSDKLHIKPLHLFEKLFIDRVKEIKEIVSFLNATTETHRVLMMEGLTGVGKKSLIIKAIQRAQLSGYLVIDLSNNLFEQNLLEHFIDALSANLEVKIRDLMISKHKSIIKSIQNFTGSTDTRPKKESVLVIYNNIIQFLHKLSIEQPILICISNINLVGEDFIQFLNHLAYRTDILGSNTKLIISKEIDLPMDQRKSNLYDQIKSYKFSHVLEVKPFNQDKLKKLIKAIFDQDLFPKKEIELLHSRTKGIPLFVTELIKHLIHKGVIQWDNVDWYLDRKSFRETYIPKSIEDIIKSTFKELTQKDKIILQILSLWGENISIKELSRLTMLTNYELQERVKNLIQKYILVKNSDGTIALNNPIYSQTIIKHTPSIKRKKFNAAIAETLEALNKKDPVRIARHYISAKNTDKALKYGILASDYLLSKQELYNCLTLLSDLKKLIMKLGTKPQITPVLVRLAPIEYQLGRTLKAIKDYQFLTTQAKDDRKKADYLLQTAFIHDDLWGQKERPRKLYYEALKYAERAGDQDLIAEILVNIGEVLEEKRLETIEKAAKISKNRNINIYSRALSKLLYIYKVTGSINKMEITLKKINRIINKINVEEKKNLLLDLTAIYFYRGDYINSKKNVLEKINLEEATQDELGKIDSFKLLGGIFFVQGKFHDTINILKRALNLTEKYNDFLGSLTIIGNLSLVYRYLAEYSESQRLLYYGSEIIKKHNIRQVNSVYLNKHVYLDLFFGNAKQKEFLQYSKRSRNNSIKFKNLIGLGHYYLARSIYYYHNLDNKRALKISKKALSLFREADDKDDIVETLCWMSIYLIENKKSNEASNNILEAEEIYNEIKCEYIKPFLLFVKGFLSMSISDNSSFKILTQALRSSKKIGTREYTWLIQRALALNYKKLGELDKTKMYYNDAVETIKQIMEYIEGENLKMSYLSVPIRKRVFNEIRSLKQDILTS